MSADQEQIFSFSVPGIDEPVTVPVAKRQSFLDANPGAVERRRYRVPGIEESVWIPDGKPVPEGAERVYRFRDAGGETYNVPRSKLGAHIEARKAPDKDRSWGSYAGEAYADAAKAVGQAVGTVASNAADVARRIPAAAEGFLDRAAVAPALLAGRVADALNPDPLAGPVDVLTGQRGRYSPQEMGYEEDPYRQGLASRTADKARAWLARRDEARAPKTAAGRVADVPVQFGTTLVGYSTPVGPLAMVGNAAAAGDRAYAEGASGARALGRTATSLGAPAAACGPKPSPAPGATAAGRAAEGAAARIGGRLAQTPEGAARAVRTAVTAGQVARGAVESGARMAGVTAAEGGDAKDVLIAAGVGGAVGGALRGLSTRPLARVAGDAAGRMARGGVDTPPPRMDPAGLAANRAEATARTPEGDAALARANAGLASPERAGLPAPAEPGAVPTVYGQRTIVPPYYGPTVSRPGEPITPPAPYADKVPEPIPETREEVVRRRKEALDALPLPQRLKKTGFSAYYDQYPDRAGVLDAIGFEKFAKLYRKYKGDFRNVTGDLVNASEVGGIVGHDYSGADGVRRALEDAAQEYAGYVEWKEQGAPTAEEEMQTGQEVAWNRARNAEAEAEVRRRYELTHPEMTGEPRVTEEEIRAAQAAAEQGEVERIEAEAMQEPEPAVSGGASRPGEPQSPANAPAGSAAAPRANISRRYTAKPLVFQNPIVGPSGARIVSYEWTNKPVEYVDKRGEDRVKRVSDWDFSNENEDTGRQIVHNFVIEMPDGSSRAVSAESAAKALGYPVGKFKTEALREIRQAMLVDSLPAEQVAGFVEALGRSTRAGARNAYPIYKQTDKVSILKDGTIRIVGNRKADGIIDRWPVVITTVSTDGTIKTERRNAWPSTKGKDISAEAISGRNAPTAPAAVAPAPVAESAAPSEPFSLDGGTPAEIDAEKARVAEKQKRAALEEQAAAPGKDLGTVTIQEGLPGIGGDGTLFTPPSGGWSGRVASGPARGDVAAEAPRLAETARPTTAGTRPATPDGPREALRQELKVMMDAGATASELDAFAQRAEAADAFATAALARQAAGTYRGTPWGTEGGNWPHEEPPAARASMGDLFMLARSLGDGSSPGVVRRIARLLGGRAAGVFRGMEGEPDSGSVQITSGLFGLVDARERAAIRDRAQAEAERTGEDFAEVHSRMLGRAIRENAFAGPKRAMAVLAHEIGHWVDFLDEGTLKRGNVLGHLAALKKWAGHQIFPSKAAADAAGAPGVTDAIVKARAEEWGVSQAEARRRLTEGADLQALPDLRREMESLVAWYRQSDGAPDYFRNDPAELYAEAFSAWVNYPAETARRAPAFASTMDGWLDARPKAAAALREFRDGVTQAEARAAKAAGDTTNPAFFAALDQDQAAARRAEELADRLTDKALAERSFGGMAEDAHARIKVALTGADDILKGELMRSPLGAFNAHNLPLWRAMQQKDNANNRMVLWDYRYRTFVEPLLSGVPRPTFLNFLYHSRVARELLGPDATRGRMNLPNANGLTPGDVTRAEGNAQTSSAAWLNELRRTQPEVYEKCERARREFWSKVRNGGDELGGEGSPMDVVRNSPCLSAEQKAALLGNEWYVAFRPAMVPDVSRPVASGEMSVWDGIFSQRTGSEKPVGDVLANTLLQDLTMQDQLLRQEYRLRAVDWLRANKAEWVGEPAEVTADPATGRRSVAQREKPGWRVVAFLRNGKPEGWWVRDFIADALAPKPHQRTSAEPFRNALNASARGINALKTTLNPAFGVANTLKDAFSIALRQMPRDTSGLGHAQALLAGVQNWLGDYGAMMRSFRDNSAADLVHGKWNADTARALAWGALNNAAPNQSAYAGGGERGGVGDIAARYREEGRSEISDADLRRAMKTFGYTERQISDALDRTEGPLARALREAGRVTGARWLADQHGRLMAFLSRGEIRTKSFALAEAMRRRPDLTREELVQWTHDMIGTPAMNNRPTVAKFPGIGHLVPFLTPRVHGWTDQLFGALRTGWTGGPGRSAQVASRIAFTTAMMAIPLAAVGILRGEAEEAEKAGDKERADELRRMARRWQAIPSSDILSGICFPDPTSETRHVKIPVDPTIIPMAGLALEAIFGGKDLPKGAGAERFTGDLLPTMGTVPTLALGNKTGVDPNTGRAVIGERTPGLDRLLWNWDQLTARGLGMLPGSMLRAWMVGQEDAREIEKAGRADKIPFVSALWRPFLRRSGYGLVERAGAMRDADAADSRRATAIAERVVQGREVPAEDLEWFGANVASPGESLRAAALRMQRLRTMAPDERAAEALPVRRRERIEREAGYIAPPRLTDEDRNR